MKFLFYFRLSSYLLVACGLLALSVTEFFGPVSITLFVGILAVGWLVDNDKIHIPISNRFWNFLLLPVAFLCGADILFIRRYPIIGIVSFLIFLQVSKLFQKKENKDYFFLYAISFIQLLTVAVVTSDVIFSVPFILYTILATWTLTIFYLKREIEIHEKDENVFRTPRVEQVLNPSFFLGTSVLTVVMFAIILTIFFFVPRVSVGYFFQEKEKIQRISGFSDEVKLGSFGNTRLNHTPIMRVAIPDTTRLLPASVHWRGLSLDYYDGYGWKVSKKQEKRVAGKQEITSEGAYLFNVGVTNRASIPLPKEKLLKQEVEIAPSTTDIFFGAYQVRGISGIYAPLSVDALSEVIRSGFPAYRGRKYIVYSDVTAPSEKDLRQASANYGDFPDLQKTYTQLPPISPEIRVLAGSLTEKYINPYDKAKAIERYLQDNFTYALNVTRDEGMSPLDDFLFKHQAGHCEYFATGMIVLLRSVGIPARMVNGFQQGQWNEFGKYYIVRQSDAHSWVEVFFPSLPTGSVSNNQSSGIKDQLDLINAANIAKMLEGHWVAFDPTPFSAFSTEYTPVLDRIPLVNTLNRYLDYIQMRWNRYIVQYNLMDQIDLMLSLRKGIHRLQSQFTGNLEGLKSRLSRINTLFRFHFSIFDRQFSIPFSAIGLVMVALGMVFFRSRRETRLKELLDNPSFSSHHLKVVKLYLNMLHILSKKGFRKEKHWTPQEFVHQLKFNQVPCVEEVQTITRLYYKARYGGTPISSEEIKETGNLLKAIKASYNYRS
jgi:transglutaminase-like putative cysteine protease